MEIEFDTVYRPGARTFMYLAVIYGWWLIGTGAGLVYLAFALYRGSLHAPTEEFLAGHPDWFLEVSTLAQWALLAGLAFLLIAYLRVAVQYRWYSFSVDEHAFHLRRGLISVQEITVPYRQVSNVHMDQPYHWRLFGLAQLDITMSNSRDMIKVRKKKDFLLPCIDKPLARSLSRFLVSQASGEADEDDFEDDEDDGEDAEIEGNK